MQAWQAMTGLVPLIASVVETYVQIQTARERLKVGRQVPETVDPLDLLPKPTKEEMLERGDYWQGIFTRD
jgi:hypothetical protein